MYSTGIVALAMEKSRRPVNVVLIHDGNQYEKEYLIYQLQRYIPDLTIIQIENYSTFQSLHPLDPAYEALISTVQEPQLKQFKNVLYLDRSCRISIPA